MKVREKEDTAPNSSFYVGKFNIHAFGEVVGCGDDFGCNLFFIKDLDVFLESNNQWKDMRSAFKDCDLITDNYNTCFFEPVCEEDKKRGYTLGIGER